MTTDLERIRGIRNHAKLIVSASAVEKAIDQMAVELTLQLRDSNPLVCCMMKGGLFLTGALLKRLPFPLELDYIQVSRYRGQIEGGELLWKVKPETSLRDRVVLLLDDIFDEGITLQTVADYCSRQGAREVVSAVLVRKMHDKNPVDYQPDYIGFSLGDLFYVGCGMDYQGYMRNLPGIYAI